MVLSANGDCFKTLEWLERVVNVDKLCVLLKIIPSSPWLWVVVTGKVCFSW